MSARNTLIGTAKQIVAEVVGDGRLAEEGSRQASEGDFDTAEFPQRAAHHLKKPPGHR